MATTDSKLKAAILIVSETASQDPSTDKCIPILKEVFGNLGNDQWDVSTTEIVPDHVLTIQKTIRTWADGAEPVNLIVTSGGTGFATKDVTPEVRVSSSTWLDDVTNRKKAVTPLIDRHAPGLV
jgi:gephyrin